MDAASPTTTRAAQMAKGISFNFGANAKPKKPRTRKGGKGKRAGNGRTSGSKSNAWRSYISNAPIPD